MKKINYFILFIIFSFNFAFAQNNLANLISNQYKNQTKQEDTINKTDIKNTNQEINKPKKTAKPQAVNTQNEVIMPKANFQEYDIQKNCAGEVTYMKSGISICNANTNKSSTNLKNNPINFVSNQNVIKDNNKKFKIILDSGHNPNTDDAGAVSISGKDEVFYNDRMVEELYNLLIQENFQVMLTRRKNESISLKERAELANKENANLFISIHHDSAKEKFLSELSRRNDNKIIYKTTNPIEGYGIFVSNINPQYEKAVKFAVILGNKLNKIRPVNKNHHLPDAKNLPFINESLGIYRYDKLSVLKNTKVPSVLIEIAVIVDEMDEQKTHNPNFRRQINQMIVSSIVEYFAQ